jgi:hypothetical protein
LLDAPSGCSKGGAGVKGLCALCKEDAELQLSHILPKFVTNYLKDMAPTAIRSNRIPNRRVQDGEKEYLLCRKCEQLFSGWEKTFSENLFVPLHSPSPVRTPLKYKQWALKFAVSVSWRVLLYQMRRGRAESLSPQQKDSAEQALEVWRRFLIGKERHPGRFEQHLLPLDVIESHSAERISNFLNRYFLGVVQMDVPSSTTSVFTYAKLCRVIIFGFIEMDEPLVWRGTKLHVNKGEIIPRRYVIPRSMVNYINDNADRARKALSALSPQQERKVDHAIKENLDELANSEIFRAMSYDIAQSGKAAFKPKKTTTKE